MNQFLKPQPTYANNQMNGGFWNNGMGFGMGGFGQQQQNQPGYVRPVKFKENEIVNCRIHHEINPFQDQAPIIAAEEEMTKISEDKNASVFCIATNVVGNVKDRLKKEQVVPIWARCSKDVGYQVVLSRAVLLSQWIDLSMDDAEWQRFHQAIKEAMFAMGFRQSRTKMGEVANPIVPASSEGANMAAIEALLERKFEAMASQKPCATEDAMRAEMRRRASFGDLPKPPMPAETAAATADVPMGTCDAGDVPPGVHDVRAGVRAVAIPLRAVAVHLPDGDPPGTEAPVTHARDVTDSGNPRPRQVPKVAGAPAAVIPPLPMPTNAPEPKAPNPVPPRATTAPAAAGN